MEALIEKIHNQFRTSSEVTLKKAKKYAMAFKPIEIKASEDVNFLKSIGFNNVDFVRDHDEFNADAENKNKLALKKIEYENLQFERVLELNKAYPNYKVVLYSSMKSICDKYGLICTESKFYTGTIPNKNIKELQEFTKTTTIADSDLIVLNYANNSNVSFYVRKGQSQFKAELIKKRNIFEKYPRILKDIYYDDYDNLNYDAMIPDFYPPRINHMNDDAPNIMKGFYICAPSIDFDFKKFSNPTRRSYDHSFLYAKNNETLANAKNLQPLDPAVLVAVKGIQYDGQYEPMFLVVSLWGIEKYDPMLSDKPFDKTELN